MVGECTPTHGEEGEIGFFVFRQKKKKKTREKERERGKSRLEATTTTLGGLFDKKSKKTLPPKTGVFTENNTHSENTTVPHFLQNEQRRTVG